MWHGRILALAGIVLIALSLRTAIGAVSPIVNEIGTDVPLDSIRIGVIGMLPPLCFAIFGLLAPLSSKKLGLELTTILVVVMMTVGHVTRAFAGDFVGFLIGSVLAFAGTGIGNALLPPLVKRYFPDRIGILTSLYAGALSVSAFLPPLVAVPIAHSTAGWRVSLAIWGVLAAVAAIPWVIMLRGRLRSERVSVPADRHEAGLPLRFLIRSKIAWAILIIFACSSMTMYAVFAWLPLLLVETAGVSPSGAGTLLALYAAVGFPASMLIPILVTRMKNVAILVIFGVACLSGGILGFVLVPTVTPWLWVVGLACGRMLFPIAMTLVNLRTRTHQNSLDLSGFVNGLGYTIGLFGPFLFGVLHDISGAWIVPLLMLLVPAAGAVIATVPLARPRMLEEEISSTHQPA